MNEIILRDYQEIGVENIRKSLKSGFKAPLFVLPTGGGKTIIFSYIAKSVESKQKKVLILVHRIELLKQAVKALVGSNVGIINPKFTPNFHANIQVASVQTLVNRMNLYSHFDLIIIDEAHHSISNTYKEIIDNYNTTILGVTATPIRGDGKGLGRDSGGCFDDLIVGSTVKNLIAKKNLVEPKIYSTPNKIDLSGIKKKGSDYDKEELSIEFDKPSITGNAVIEWNKICKNTLTVVFCINVLHAQHVANEFNANGISSKSIDGTMNDIERNQILSDFEKGKILVLTSVDLVGEGFDLPKIGAIIMLRPTLSTGLYIQQIGRVLRPSDGKECGYVLDHVGNVQIHGLPTMDREWSLDGEVKTNKKNKQEKTLKLKQCESCYHIHEPAPECPECGFKYEVKTRNIVHKDGELVEIKEQEIQQKLDLKKEVAKARTLEELQRIANQRNYKEGWAKHVFESRKNR